MVQSTGEEPVADAGGVINANENELKLDIARSGGSKLADKVAEG